MLFIRFHAYLPPFGQGTTKKLTRFFSFPLPLVSLCLFTALIFTFSRCKPYERNTKHREPFHPSPMHRLHDSHLAFRPKGSYNARKGVASHLSSNKNCHRILSFSNESLSDIFFGFSNKLERKIHPSSSFCHSDPVRSDGCGIKRQTGSQHC